VNQHPGRVPFVHADLYRINHASEIAELGLTEAYDYAATAIEWLDRFPTVARPIGSRSRSVSPSMPAEAARGRGTSSRAAPVPAAPPGRRAVAGALSRAASKNWLVIRRALG